MSALLWWSLVVQVIIAIGTSTHSAVNEPRASHRLAGLVVMLWMLANAAGLWFFWPQVAP